MTDEYRSEDSIDYDPNPVYLDDEEEEKPSKKRKKAAAKEPEPEFDLLPSQRGERVGPVRVFMGSNDDGEGIEIPVDDEKQWYVIHCYSGYENKVRHAIEQRIETMGMQDKIFDVVVPTEEE